MIRNPIAPLPENLLPKLDTLGSRIILVCNRGENLEIYTMRQGGEEQVRLTSDYHSDSDRAYAPATA